MHCIEANMRTHERGKPEADGLGARVCVCVCVCVCMRAVVAEEHRQFSDDVEGMHGMCAPVRGETLHARAKLRRDVQPSDGQGLIAVTIGK